MILAGGPQRRGGRGPQRDEPRRFPRQLVGEVRERWPSGEVACGHLELIYWDSALGRDWMKASRGLHPQRGRARAGGSPEALGTPPGSWLRRQEQRWRRKSFWYSNRSEF